MHIISSLLGVQVFNKKSGSRLVKTPSMVVLLNLILDGCTIVVGQPFVVRISGLLGIETVALVQVCFLEK